jgi:hypothetical protein
VRWLFSDDCDNKRVLSYEHMFSPLDWWKEFVDKLIVSYLATRFQSVDVIPPHPEYDVFHRLITRWTPVFSLQSLNHALSDFMKNCVGGLYRWLMDDSLTKEEAIAWHRDWMQLLPLDVVGIDTTAMDTVIKVIQQMYQ